MCDIRKVQLGLQRCEREISETQRIVVNYTMRKNHWQEECDHKLKVDNMIKETCSIETTLQLLYLREIKRELSTFMVITPWKYLELDSKLGGQDAECIS